MQHCYKRRPRTVGLPAETEETLYNQYLQSSSPTPLAACSLAKILTNFIFCSPKDKHLSLKQRGKIFLHPFNPRFINRAQDTKCSELSLKGNLDLVPAVLQSTCLTI